MSIFVGHVFARVHHWLRCALDSELKVHTVCSRLVETHWGRGIVANIILYYGSSSLSFSLHKEDTKI